MLTVHGRARFAGPVSLRVGDETYAGSHVVIAAGARHARLGIAGEEHLTTSTGFLELGELPRKVAFVGGGYIAFELAHVAARAGAEVTVLHRGERRARPPMTETDITPLCRGPACSPGPAQPWYKSTPVSRWVDHTRRPGHPRPIDTRPIDRTRRNRNAECNWDRRSVPGKRKNAEYSTGQVFTFGR